MKFEYHSKKDNSMENLGGDYTLCAMKKDISPCQSLWLFGLFLNLRWTFIQEHYIKKWVCF
jgi:hypothetical protein